MATIAPRDHQHVIRRIVSAICSCAALDGVQPKEGAIEKGKFYMSTETVFVICLRADLEKLTELLDDWLANGDFYANDGVFFDPDGSTDKLHHKVITCQFVDEAPAEFIQLLTDNGLVFDFILNYDGGEQVS